MTPELAAQLAALKEAHSSPKSDTKKQSHISLFIAIYLKSELLCNLNYMEGAEILYSWLSPNLPLPVLAKDLPRIPQLFRTYEVTQLAKVISPDTSSKHWVHKRAVAEDMIYLVGKELV